MKYGEIIDRITDIFEQRENEYGDFTESLNRAAKIATLTIGTVITAWDIAVIMHCLKLSRLHNEPGKADTYLDAINYLAFAGELSESE